MGRSQELQTFIDATRDAFAASGASADALVVAGKIFSAANAVPGEEATPDPIRMPVCEHLNHALERARGEGGPIAALAEALAESDAAARAAADAAETAHANALSAAVDAEAASRVAEMRALETSHLEATDALETKLEATRAELRAGQIPRTKRVIYLASAAVTTPVTVSQMTVTQTQWNVHARRTGCD